VTGQGAVSSPRLARLEQFPGSVARAAISNSRMWKFILALSRNDAVRVLKGTKAQRRMGFDRIVQFATATKK